MKRLIVTAAMAAVVGMTLAATASADVPRYQTQTATFTVTQPYGAVGQWTNLWTHDYTITTIDPCDGSFVGTGVQGNNVGDPYTATETITGTFGPDSVSFTAVRSDGVFWTLTDAPFGGAVTLATVTPAVPWAVEMKVTEPVFTATSNYRNHGDYVNQAKAKGVPAKIAGPSCLGRPLPLSFTQSGTVDAASLAGTTITLPDEGTYRIDVSGTWDNGVWYDVDAEYVQQTDLAWAQGWPGYPTVDFGDLQVDGQFVDWGAYNAAHAYSYTAQFSGAPVNLRVWDMWADLVTDGHADNVGSLSYTITYLGA